MHYLSEPSRVLFIDRFCTQPRYTFSNFTLHLFASGETLLPFTRLSPAPQAVRFPKLFNLEQFIEAKLAIRESHAQVELLPCKGRTCSHIQTTFYTFGI